MGIILPEPIKCLSVRDHKYRSFVISIAEFDDGIFMYDIEGNSVSFKCENYETYGKALEEAHDWIDIYLNELDKFMRR